MLTTIIFIDKKKLKSRIASRKSRMRCQLLIAAIILLLSLAGAMCSFYSAYIVYTAPQAPVTQAFSMDDFKSISPVLSSLVVDISPEATPAAAALRIAPEEMTPADAAAIAGETLLVGRDYNIPAEASAFKSYMDYRAITNSSTKSWEMQHSDRVYTDSEGFRRYDGYYMVAMGTYYCDSVCGKTFRITMESGSTVDVIIGDVKSDQHTDALGQYHMSDKSLVEFIVDKHSISSLSKEMGDVSYAHSVDLAGEIVRIQELS